MNSRSLQNVHLLYSYYQSWTAVPTNHWVKKSDVIKRAPRVHDWNVSNIIQRWRPILPADWEPSSSELMIVTWGQTAEAQTEGGRHREGGREGAKVITLSLVHCCLLSDLIWSRRHTWAKAHPSQVLQDPSFACALLPSIHPSIPIFLRLALSFQGSLRPSPSIRLRHALSVSLFLILFSHCPSSLAAVQFTSAQNEIGSSGVGALYVTVLIGWSKLLKHKRWWWCLCSYTICSIMTF